MHEGLWGAPAWIDALDLLQPEPEYRLGSNSGVIREEVELLRQCDNGRMSSLHPVSNLSRVTPGAPATLCKDFESVLLEPYRETMDGLRCESSCPKDFDLPISTSLQILAIFSRLIAATHCPEMACYRYLRSFITGSVGCYAGMCVFI